jgi:16S rRNA (cytidine1402-2'-O)-methyltransferase
MSHVSSALSFAASSAQSISGASEQHGCLYIVPTPIGNLADISQRALDILATVDAIGCEDTRHSRTLLQHYNINTATFAVHDHNESMQVDKVIQRLEKGDNIALVSDAGTPLISDPGYVLVKHCRERGLPVVSLPGPCAAITALAGAGLPTDEFHFFGFLPVKQQAKTQRLQALNQQSFTSVFYESPRRVLDTMQLAHELLSDNIQVVLAKELSKAFETFVAGSTQDVINWLMADAVHQKGEFVLMFGPAELEAQSITPEAQHLLTLLLSEMPPKKAAGIVAEHYGLKKNAVYQWHMQNKSKD